MRIAFLCSSLESGQDGVGDYTRRLAAECIRQSHPSIILGLNDAGVRETLYELQEMEGASISVMRLPSSMSWRKRAMLGRKWLDAFDPDWVSLQFGPFAYQPKGLPFGLPRRLLSITGARPLHWMFHELWILWRLPLPLRQRLLGQFQKLCIRLCLIRLNPKAIATQLPLHQAELAKRGWAAEVVPLHGNIPVHPDGAAHDWLVNRCGLLPGSKWVKAGFFGNILPTLNPALFTARMAEIAKPGAKLLLLSAGRIGEKSAKLWSSLERELRAPAAFFNIGELNEHESSLYFSALDYGLTSYPPELVGKSGSVAAMLEHGLSVVICGSLVKGSVASGKMESGTWDAERHWTVRQSAESLLRQLQASKS